MVMKVLQIIGSMDVGGAETMIMNIYRKIDRTQIQFDFLVSVEKECFYDKEIMQLGGNIHHTVAKSRNPVKFCIDLWNLIRQNKYAIVHVHASNAMAAIPAIVAALAGVKKRIVHSHNSSDNCNRVLHLAMRPILNVIATDKFSCSDLASKWMFGRNLDAVRTVNSPIDCLLFRHNADMREKMRSSLGLKTEKTYVHVGRFSKQKNHSFLIDIFEEIYRKDSNSVLLLIGTGELQPEIEAKVAGLNLEASVRFMGIRADVYNVLQACDGFLFPSLHEGLPLTLIEAQAAGLRCYVSDVITKQVEITGLIEMTALTKTPEEWAEIVLSSIERQVDKEQCNKLVFALFDANSVARQFAQGYYAI